MYKFYVRIPHKFVGEYNVQIPSNGKMDLIQAIDYVAGTFGKLYPGFTAEIQFLSLVIQLKK